MPKTIYCSFEEMIENDYLANHLGDKDTTDGFTIGKNGKAKFYMYDPTTNGYYKIYQQDSKGHIVGIRYITANIMVTVHLL